MYSGQSLQLRRIAGDLAELSFDRQGETVNKFDRGTVAELRQAVEVLGGSRDVKGLLVTSAKDAFIVGADITEFGAMFSQSEAEIAEHVRASNEVFVAFEDLPIPSVVAINGFALGGGLEFALAAALRVAAEDAQVGVPEVKLGLFPGFGGTVRLARVAALATAVEWISDGAPRSAAQALACSVVDQVCAPGEDLRTKALDILAGAVEGQIDWRARQHRKTVALADATQQLASVPADARARIAALAASHQPAAAIAMEMMERGATLDRAAALREENLAFARVARTQAAASLVQIFLNDQTLKKAARNRNKGGQPVTQVAVLGAGIMGGGIALTSARAGIPARVKDVSAKALDAMMSDASRALQRQTRAGRLKPEQADAVMAALTPQTDEVGFEGVDIVVEAIVERLELKHTVLATLEDKLRPGTVIASNTSSLRIDDIALGLQRPEDFVGLHFFNPVPAMKLVEVVRGGKSSDAAVATAVAYAVAIGKTPLVVKDCPGFLVNRVLMAYTGAALRLLAEGVDFVQIDRAMEAFGWPMGPIHLQDVIGIDTGGHVADVIAAGYPQRMPPIENNALQLMQANGRLGQKSGLGFYRYERDAQGRVHKTVPDDTHALLTTLRPIGSSPIAMNAEQIVDRLMLPFVVEAAHALEEGVAASAAELDTALLLALGCPPYIGGALKYADWLGLGEVVRRCDALRHFGPMYEPTERMRHMAADRERFFPA